jgi:AbrB family looped-hinge helix DNA binding protein
MTTATVSKKGWVVIPQAYRRRYNLQPGSRVTFIDHDGILAMVPVPEDPIAAAYGMFAHLGGDSWTEEIIAEHARERAKENEKW